MERWRNKVVVVTGASAGIGAACVKTLALAGLQVIGLARRHERVLQLKNELSGGFQDNLHARRCDVSREDSVQETFKWIEETFGGVDVLVNNAGIMATTQLSNRDNTKEIRSTIETNLMGTVFCTREAFHSMQQRKVEGHVFILNSVAGHQVPNLGPDLPSLNIYPATKFALRAMTEIYRQEFQYANSKVRISSISPGVVDTDILPSNIQGVIKQFMPMLKANDVAEAILWTLGTPPNVQVHNIVIKPVGEKF